MFYVNALYFPNEPDKTFPRTFRVLKYEGGCD